LNTVEAVRGIHPLLIDVARVHHFSQRRTLLSVVLPAALPQIMAGLRVSLALALILALVSEMVGADQGLGHLIVTAQRGFRMTDVYAAIVLLALLGYTLNRLFVAAQHRILIGHSIDD
ncbi:MAG: ABC transporter permease subunit, partial [Chloroflexota bacterium]|nr:ABC transporter permease subunit [Chloroflexota bacterium]